MCIITFHELGHVLTSLIFNWQIDKVIILPFGAITIFNEHINRPIKEELLICIMGPLFQLFLFIINDDLFKIYNLNLLLFNLIPILPLDGSKILNLILNKILPFKDSHLISIFISLILIIFIISYKHDLIIILTLIFLCIKTIKELKLHNYIYHKFLFERYLYKYNFKKTKIVRNITKFKRDYKHIIKYNKKYINEDDFLTKLFDK